MNDTAAATDDVVVVGVDGSPASSTAVAYAAEHALAAGRRITLVAALEANGILPEPPRHRPDDHDWEVLRRIADAAREEFPGLDVRTELHLGEPVTTLLEASKEAGSVVVGKRGLGTFGRMMLGSTSTSLAGRAQVPVTVVPKEWRTGRRPWAPIVVGINVDDPEERTLRWAFAEAERRGVPLEVVHVVDLQPVLVWDAALGGATYRHWEARGLDLMAQALDPLQTRHPGVHVARVEERGDTATVLLARAHDAQLLVIGRHHDGVFGFGLGSVERAVLHYAEVPVTVVPTT